MRMNRIAASRRAPQAPLWRRREWLGVALLALGAVPRAGVLMSYNSSLDDTVRRVAYYIDRILKGTPAGDLPVEQARRFYLSLNLKTARALGLNLPQPLLQRADEVFE
jgi:putative ABC transport system substrate-binding protein